MRILRARKSFGGKTRHIWTDVTYRINSEKLTHAYLKRPYFFFFGGKIFYLKQPFNVVEPAKKLQLSSPRLWDLSILAPTQNIFERNALPLFFKSCISLGS